MADRRRQLTAWLAAVRRGERPPLPGWLRLLVKLAMLLPLIALVGMAGFVSFSNTPRFCISCHYMKPFYDAWKTSSHNHVACVQCHIPPGAKNWIKHKSAAAVQVVKYVTRQYGIKPWTEVDDASCLRSGCHETRLLAGKVDFGGVTFDHGPHLSAVRRVTRLRCTSCHAQIVQGSHMTVTVASCFLCHFKNAAEEPDMARCTRCHDEIRPHRQADVPSESWVKERATPAPAPKLRYDHKLVQQRQVDCRTCHNDVVRGEGEVPRARCLSCHTEPERLEKYDDVKFMHRQHVTDHKVDCMRCHVEVIHALPPKAETPQTTCQTCHPDEHAKTRQLYRGEGGLGVAGKGNPMFDARVPCAGCHMDHQDVDGTRITTRAGAAGCMLCHGEQYGQALTRWREDAVRWTSWATTALARTKEEIRLEASRHDIAGARGMLDVVEENVKLVQAGHFIHNPDYCVQLLQVARDRANAALQQAGSNYRWPPAPSRGAVAPSDQSCATCHTEITSQSGVVFGEVFDHELHVGQRALACQRCHEGGAQPQARAHGRLKLTRDDCRQCHEQQMRKSPHEPGWRQVHGGFGQRQPEQCAVCHSQASCDGCHGTRIPHQAGWSRRHGSQTRGSQSCRQCHATAFCDSCHGLELPHPRGWRGEHGARAEASPQTCARCHEQADCQSCHRQSPPRSHRAANWDSGHGSAGQRQGGTCALCHGPASCTNCHGVAMPHPAGWALNGHGPVARRQARSCQKCHQQSYCQQCHSTATGAAR